MKVILLTEVQGKGGEGDVVEVARGFFNNYLGPQKKAVLATAGNLKQLEQRRGNIAKREEKRIADAEALKASLEGKKIFVDAKVGEGLGARGVGLLRGGERLVGGGDVVLDVGVEGRSERVRVGLRVQRFACLGLRGPREPARNANGSRCRGRRPGRR